MLTVDALRARVREFLNGQLPFPDLQFWSVQASFGEFGDLTGEAESALRDLQARIDHAVGDHRTREEFARDLRAWLALDFEAERPPFVSVRFVYGSADAPVTRRDQTGTAASQFQTQLQARFAAGSS